MRRRVLFLNQYFPPDPAPTGMLLRELGDHLEAAGWETEYVAAGQSYHGEKKGSRAIREMRALGSILGRGLRARRPDVVFSASSPPCLAVAAAVIAMRHRARAVHWLMDMYPELAVALGEIRSGSAIARLTTTLMKWAYRFHHRVVALDDDMAVRLRDSYQVGAEVISPWLLQPLHRKEPDPPPDPEPVWIYSGNLGRAHEWETLLQAQAVLEAQGAPWRLLFQGGGPSWAKARARAEQLGLRHCEWQPYASAADLRSSLARSQVLIVTQRLETQGLLWPSKLALALDLGRPLLWVGPAGGAIARRLERHPKAAIFQPGEGRGIAAWLQNPILGNCERIPNDEGTRSRAAGLRHWEELLLEVVRS